MTPPLSFKHSVNASPISASRMSSPLRGRCPLSTSTCMLASWPWGVHNLSMPLNLQTHFHASLWLVCKEEFPKLIADRSSHDFLSGYQYHRHIRHWSVRLFLICDLTDEHDLGTAPRDLLPQ